MQSDINSPSAQKKIIDTLQKKWCVLYQKSFLPCNDGSITIPPSRRSGWTTERARRRCCSLFTKTLNRFTTYLFCKQTPLTVVNTPPQYVVNPRPQLFQQINRFYICLWEKIYRLCLEMLVNYSHWIARNIGNFSYSTNLIPYLRSSQSVYWSYWNWTYNDNNIYKYLRTQNQ